MLTKIVMIMEVEFIIFLRYIPHSSFESVSTRNELSKLISVIKTGVVKLLLNVFPKNNNTLPF